MPDPKLYSADLPPRKKSEHPPPPSERISSQTSEPSSRDPATSFPALFLRHFLIGNKGQVVIQNATALLAERGLIFESVQIVRHLTFSFDCSHCGLTGLRYSFIIFPREATPAKKIAKFVLGQANMITGGLWAPYQRTNPLAEIGPTAKETVTFE